MGRVLWWWRGDLWLRDLEPGGGRREDGGCTGRDRS